MALHEGVAVGDGVVVEDLDRGVEQRAGMNSTVLARALVIATG